MSATAGPVTVEAVALIDYLTEAREEWLAGADPEDVAASPSVDCGPALVAAVERIAHHLEGAERETALSLAAAVRDITTARPFLSEEPGDFWPGFNPAIETALENLRRVGAITYGRPPVGPQVVVRMSEAMRADCDRASEAAGLTRAEWLRRVIEAALAG